MEARLLGSMSVDFVNDNGENIKGTNIFLGFKDSNVQGMRTQKFFVKEDVKFPEKVKINDVVNVAFDYRGKIESIIKE